MQFRIQLSRCRRRFLRSSIANHWTILSRRKQFVVHNPSHFNLECHWRRSTWRFWWIVWCLLQRRLFLESSPLACRSWGEQKQNFEKKKRHFKIFDILKKKNFQKQKKIAEHLLLHRFDLKSQCQIRNSKNNWVHIPLDRGRFRSFRGVGILLPTSMIRVSVMTLLTPSFI